MRYDLAKVDGKSQYLSGIDPATISQTYNFDWKTGSDATLAQLGANGAVVDKKFAEDQDLKVGDTFPIEVQGGKKTTAVVKGIYEAPPFYPILGAASITIAQFDTLYERPRNAVHVRERQGRAERRRPAAARPGGGDVPGREGAVARRPGSPTRTRTSTTS